jgi:hypothetical protein
MRSFLGLLLEFFQPCVLDLLDLVRDQAQTRHVAPQLGQSVGRQGRTLGCVQRWQTFHRLA